jgi:hypothetical protein
MLQLLPLRCVNQYVTCIFKQKALLHCSMTIATVTTMFDVALPLSLTLKHLVVVQRGVQTGGLSVVYAVIPSQTIVPVLYHDRSQNKLTPP